MIPFELKNKTALVCGASQGIGRATAILLSQMGAKVYALARSNDKLQSLKSEFGIEPVVADLENRPALRLTVEALIAKNGPIHILINNSSGPAPGPLLAAEDEEFIAALSTFARLA